MKKQIILGLLLLTYPFFSINAQKIENTNRLFEKWKIQKSVVASSFYEKMQQNEIIRGYRWKLTKAFYDDNERRSVGESSGKTTLMFFKGQSSEVSASITEYKSVDDAKFPFTIRRSQGTIKSCQREECGDEGQLIYRADGKFSEVGIRKGSFYVSVSCDSEETAMRFANYALKAIAEK